MKMNDNIIYLVEGETEKKLLEVLKTEIQCIKAGKVHKLNVVQEKINETLFLSFKGFLTCVLIFDTDNDGTETLLENIRTIKKFPNVKNVLCIPQVKNMEKELCYSCNITDIRKITGSKSKKDFKRDFLRLRNIGQKLLQSNFNPQKLWSRATTGIFKGIDNGAKQVKI